MTGRTIIDDTNMVECAWNKAGSLVTDCTIFVGRYMVWRRGLASCSRAVVAGAAVIDDVEMIETGTGERCGVMTHRAVLGDIVVQRVRRFDRADCISAIVA